MSDRPTIAKLEKMVKDGFLNIENSFTTLNEKNNMITADLLEIKDHIIKNLIESNKDLQNKVMNLKNQLQNQESMLWEHKHDIECNNQYHRRNNLELSGIPNSIDDNELEVKTIEVLKKIDVTVNLQDIEACHRLPAKNGKNKKVIVRFTNRKICSKALKNKKKLPKLDLADLNLDPTKLFISENLNKYFQRIGFECRQLKREKLIHSYKFQNEAFFIKYSEESDSFKKVPYVDTLYELFPDFYADKFSD